MFVDRLAAIRAELEAMRAESLDDVADGRLAAEVSEFGAVSALVEAEAVRRAGEWERRRLWMADGSRSARARLSREWGTGVAAAGDRLRVAAAFAAGELSYAKARLLAAGADERLPAAARASFAECEETLVEAARSLSVARVREVMDFWRAHADPDGTLDEANRRYDRRGLSVSTTFDGTVAIDGILDPESGQFFLRELRAITARMWRADHHGDEAEGGSVGGERREGCEDDRAPSTDRQRNADGLVEMARQAGAHDPSTPERTRVAAVIDADSLAGRPGRAHWADSHQPMPAETALRLACDASIMGVVLDHRLVPLAVTHAKGQVSAGLRAALVLRDGGCAAPGCAVPPEFCDVHHLVPRNEGGLHSIDNCALVCRHHHRQHHENKWQTVIDPTTGRPRTRTPDTDWTPADPSPLRQATLAGSAAGAGRPPP